MKRYVMALLMLALCVAANAQQYVVSRIWGNVDLVSGSGSKALGLGQKINANDEIVIGARDMVELIDEANKKKIVVRTKGRATVKQMVSAKNNSITSLTDQFITHLKKQVNGGSGQKVMSDPATITMKRFGDDPGETEEEPLNGFLQQIKKEYADFHRKCFEEYIKFMDQAWRGHSSKPAVPQPKVKDIPPVVFEDKKPQDTPKPIDNSKPKDKTKPAEPVEKDTVPAPISLPFDDVIAFEPIDYIQPKPHEKIPEVVIDVPKDENNRTFTFFGTELKVRYMDNMKFWCQGTSNDQVRKAFAVLGDKDYDNLIRDCLLHRYNLNLSDWGYLLMLRAMADEMCGEGTRESILLAAYVYMQSGYKVRLATDKNSLYLLVASRHDIYNKSYYNIDGVTYYSFDSLPNYVNICDVEFPYEQPLSLYIPQAPKFASRNSDVRTITSKRFNDVSVSFTSNKNLMDFYDTYPSSKFGESFMTRWAMLANTPMQDAIKEQIYPSLKKAIEGCTEEVAVNKLLNFVQTGLTYEYDEKVWGQDRAFFAEETLFYPYCDCEDRSVLFTRLVRDLMGLDCVLVYYPGHLASAVCFNEQVRGDYIDLEGSHFVIADATYINAAVGMTMPGMDNAVAKVIKLK